jgi:glycosyltransferase involved in cell wall biosynthesis
MQLSGKKPKVSVCVVTYNQKKYIRQCLQSIVDQHTNFDFEVIVGDDCSTDGTRAIVEEFSRRYPGIVSPMLHEKNVGACANFLAVHEAATGEYIAHVDGDDYTLPGKLQAQADFLDQNPECNIAWHRMQVLNDATGVILDDRIDFAKMPKDGFTREDILRFISIGFNSSKMYRSEVREFQYPGFAVVDYFANVEQVGTGRACFIADKPFGVYRAGIGIASNGLGTSVLLKKSFFYFADKYPEYTRAINSASLVLFLAALKNRRWKKCALYLPVLIRTYSFGSIKDIWHGRRMISMFKLPSTTRNSING